MHLNKVRELREESDLRQRVVADFLGVKRSTYSTWECGTVMVPLNIADKISMFYKVSLACVYGIEEDIVHYENVSSLNYKKLLQNLNKYKRENHLSYEQLGNLLGCTSVTCYRYFTGETTIPIDRLVALADLCNLSIDKLCAKEFDRKKTYVGI